MGIKYFNIEYDRDALLPGQTVSGKVRLSIIDQPKEIRAIELTLWGEAKCQWTKSEMVRNSDGETESRTTLGEGEETYFNTTLRLAGVTDGQTFELPIGDYEYPFSVSLPAPLPPSYSGTYGGISYYGKAKLDLPWARDKSEKKHFRVQSPIDLNKMTELNQPYRNKQSKMFCNWCCASGPLTVKVHIPRMVFVPTETVPITTDVDNASEVRVNAIRIGVNQIITWQASDDSAEEMITMKISKLAGVSEHVSHSVTHSSELGGRGEYPKSGNCGIIRIRYELEIVMEVSGFHHNWKLKMPITIGDIPFEGSSPDPSPPTGVGLGPPQPEVSPAGFGFASAPVESFTATHLPNTVDSHGGTPQASYGTFYPSGGATAPYPEGNATP